MNIQYILLLLFELLCDFDTLHIISCLLINLLVFLLGYVLL